VAFAQEAKKPLSLEDIEQLLRIGVSSTGVVRVIDERGVSFEVREETKDRLRKAGADARVIQGVEKAALEFARKKLERERKRAAEERRRIQEEKRKLEEAKRKEEEEKRKAEEAKQKAEEERRRIKEARRRAERKATISISPAVVPYKSRVKLRISGSGFGPNKDLRLITFMGGVISDISFLVKPRPVTNEYGAFSVVWRLSRVIRRKLLRSTGQTILVMDREGSTFGTAPLVFEGNRRREERRWVKEYMEAAREGRVIRFIVGFSVGGGFDTYTRLIARHFGKYVPGNPTTLVENMPGAGSLIAANYIYNRAKRDGTVIGNWIGGPLLLREVLGDPAIGFKGRKFNWLGVPTPDSSVCALTKASGIETVDDWFASERPIKIGATAPGSSTDDPVKLLREALGLPIKMVEGYRGTARIRLAADAGEVDGACWAWQSVKVTWRKGIESGNVRPILQLTLKSHPELKHIPLAISYAKTSEARELLKIANNAYSAAVRPYSLPPGIPKDRVRFLQKAFMDTLRDPELLEEARRSKLEISPASGEEVKNIFSSLYDLNQIMQSKLRSVLLPRK